MVKDINKRIGLLQQKVRPTFPEVLDLIKQGAYYDELTAEQKEMYCAYWNTGLEAMETVEAFLNGSLHFKLAKKPRKSLSKEIIDEVKNYLCREEH